MRQLCLSPDTSAPQAQRSARQTTVSSGVAVSRRDTPGREGRGFFGLALSVPSPYEDLPPLRPCDGGMWELRDVLRGRASAAIRAIRVSISRAC